MWCQHEIYNVNCHHTKLPKIDTVRSVVLAWNVASHFLSGTKIAPSISRDGVSRIIKKESGLVLEKALNLWDLFIWDEPAWLAGLAHFTGLSRFLPSFLLKLSLCLYEKAGKPFYVNTTQILWGTIHAFIYSYVFIAIFRNVNSYIVTFTVVHFSFYVKSSCCIYIIYF